MGLFNGRVYLEKGHHADFRQDPHGQAARGRPHPRGLQHPEGVHPSPCPPPPRWHHRAFPRPACAQAQPGQDDLPQVSVPLKPVARCTRTVPRQKGQKVCLDGPSILSSRKTDPKATWELFHFAWRWFPPIARSFRVSTFHDLSGARFSPYIVPPFSSSGATRVFTSAP